MWPFAGTAELLPVAQIKINFCNYNAAQTKQKYKAQSLNSDGADQAKSQIQTQIQAEDWECR